MNDNLLEYISKQLEDVQERIKRIEAKHAQSDLLQSEAVDIINLTIYEATDEIVKALKTGCEANEDDKYGTI